MAADRDRYCTGDYECPCGGCRLVRLHDDPLGVLAGDLRDAGAEPTVEFAGGGVGALTVRPGNGGVLVFVEGAEPGVYTVVAHATEADWLDPSVAPAHVTEFALGDPVRGVLAAAAAAVTR